MRPGIGLSGTCKKEALFAQLLSSIEGRFNPERWTPQEGPQTEMLQSSAFEVFFGGARGGGKTDGLIGDYLQDLEKWGAAWRGILIRRSYPELEDVMVRCQEILPAYGGVWHEKNKTWTFPGGAYLRLKFMEHDTDWMKYQGHSYTWIGWDELPQHPVASNYEKMTACARSIHGAPVRVRSTGNPACPGQIWVNDRFIDVAPPRSIIKVLTEDGQELTRQFIPASVYDNKRLLEKDPQYLYRRKALPEGLRKAWLEGDWNTNLGQMFAWVPRYHVLKDGPWPPPAYADLFEVIDYGTAMPFSVGWYWVDYDGVIYRAREWYGWNGEKNEGLRLPPSEVAAGIKKKEQEWGIWGRVKLRWAADNYMFTRRRSFQNQEVGPTINEIFIEVDPYLAHVEGDWRHRVRCVAQCHERLKLQFDGEGNLAAAPMFQVYEGCTHFICTVPNLVSDKHNPEDVNSDQEDHVFDEWKIALMSRPLVPQIAVARKTGPARIIEMVERGPLGEDYNLPWRDENPAIVAGYELGSVGPGSNGIFRDEEW